MFSSLPSQPLECPRFVSPQQTSDQPQTGRASHSGHPHRLEGGWAANQGARKGSPYRGTWPHLPMWLRNWGLLDWPERVPHLSHPIPGQQRHQLSRISHVNEHGFCPWLLDPPQILCILLPVHAGRCSAADSDERKSLGNLWGRGPERKRDEKKASGWLLYCTSWSDVEASASCTTTKLSSSQGGLQSSVLIALLNWDSKSGVRMPIFLPACFTEKWEASVRHETWLPRLTYTLTQAASGETIKERSRSHSKQPRSAQGSEHSDDRLWKNRLPYLRAAV